MAVISRPSLRGGLWKAATWFRDNAYVIGLVAVLALALPAFMDYWLVVSPFMVVYVLRYVVLIGVLFLAFQFVVNDSPWFVRLVMSMVLGQVILNYGFTNMVVGGGGVKFTLAEAGVLLGLLFLLPKTFKVLRQVKLFWVCMVALIVPPAIHLLPGIQKYGMAALRDVLSVVDLIYLLAGLTVCTYGLMMQRWVRWRNRFLMMWIVGSALYGLMYPISPYLLAISPGFQSYQQTIPVFGHMLTAPINAMAAVAAWYTLPQAYPKRAWLRVPLGVVVVMGTMAAVAISQSRNMYAFVLLMPIMLAFFGYRKAFTATLVGIVMMIAALGVLEVFHVKIPGRISDVTLSAIVDRFMSVSGKHGDASGAHGVNQRIDWWASSLDKWRASPDTVVFGVGYGQALTNFFSPGGDNNEGVAVREPHNSYVSSLSRGGLVYFSLWLYLIIAPIIMAIRGGRLRTQDLESNGGYRGVAIWSSLVMMMLAMSALSEPVFETPSLAAIFYFVAGVAVVEYQVVSGRLRIPGTPAP